MTYFQSGSETLVWNSPRTGYLDFAKRRIIGEVGEQFGQPGDNQPGYNYGAKLPVYDLDSEAQIGLVPQAGLLPWGGLVPYSESQALLSAGNILLLVDLP